MAIVACRQSRRWPYPRKSLQLPSDDTQGLWSSGSSDLSIHCEFFQSSGGFQLSLTASHIRMRRPQMDLVAFVDFPSEAMLIERVRFNFHSEVWVFSRSKMRVFRHVRIMPRSGPRRHGKKSPRDADCGARFIVNMGCVTVGFPTVRFTRKSEKPLGDCHTGEEEEEADCKPEFEAKVLLGNLRLWRPRVASWNLLCMHRRPLPNKCNLWLLWRRNTPLMQPM